MPPKRKQTAGDPGEGEPPTKAAKSAAKPTSAGAKPKKPTYSVNAEYFAKVLPLNHSKWHLVN